MRNLRFGNTQGEPSCTHGEFLELCAISTSGALTDVEFQRLEAHLTVCRECRDAMRQFDEVVAEVIPVVASEYPCEEDAATASWSQGEVLLKLMKRLDNDDSSKKPQPSTTFSSARALFAQSSDTWRNIWLLYAAGILLFAALSLSLYRIDLRRGASVANVDTRAADAVRAATGERLSDAQLENERERLAESDGIIASLRRDLRRQLDDLNHFKLEQRRLEIKLRDADLGKQNLAQERSQLAQKLEAAQSQVESLRYTLASAEKESSEQNATALALQTHVHDLMDSLETRNKTIDEEQELLAHDRDIRELMGARDLYIAEVYDVDGNGKTRRPFGRVFYTEGKSLVFYAYDLDQQTAVRNASIFQAWGMHGANREQAVSLGIFYEDNTSKKRWVLKTSDPNVLDRVDEVFVTVEPSGGSHKPSTKTLLFAYLKAGVNHP